MKINPTKYFTMTLASRKPTQNPYTFVAYKLILFINTAILAYKYPTSSNRLGERFEYVNILTKRLFFLHISRQYMTSHFYYRQLLGRKITTLTTPSPVNCAQAERLFIFYNEIMRAQYTALV